MSTLGEHNKKEYNRLFNRNDGWQKSDFRNPDLTWNYIKRVKDDKILADEIWRIGKVQDHQYEYTLNQKRTYIIRKVRRQR